MTTVEFRRNGLIALAVCLAALAIGVGLVLRGMAGFGVVLLAVGLAYGWAAWDARTPTAVIDGSGAHLRFGRSWRNLPWDLVEEVEHLPRTSDEWWRDGRVSVLLREGVVALPGVGRLERVATAVSRRIYGSPYVVAIGLMSHSSRAAGDLTSALRAIAPPEIGIVEVDPVISDLEDPDAHPVSLMERSGTITASASTMGIPVVRAEDAPEAAAPAETTAPAGMPVINDTMPVAVIGLRIAVARAKRGLTLADLSASTHIDVEVLAAMEKDDFTPCGGDFYARTYLDTVARALGIDPEHLVKLFERGFAHHALAGDQSAAPGSDGPTRRSFLAPSTVLGLGAAVLVGWLLTSLTTSHEVGDSVSTVAATTGDTAAADASVDLTITAAGGAADVTVTDAQGVQLLGVGLAYGSHQTISVQLPVTVSTSDGSALVSVRGQATRLGNAGEPASREIIAS